MTVPNHFTTLRIVEEGLLIATQEVHAVDGAEGGKCGMNKADNIGKEHALFPLTLPLVVPREAIKGNVEHEVAQEEKHDGDESHHHVLSEEEVRYDIRRTLPK